MKAGSGGRGENEEGATLGDRECQGRGDGEELATSVLGFIFCSNKALLAPNSLRLFPEA